MEIKSEALSETLNSPLSSIVIPVFTSTHYIDNNVESAIDIVAILWAIYLIGVVVFSLKFMYQIFKLIQFIKKGEVVTKNRHYMICTNGQYPTSSFFGYVLWDNTVSYSDKELDQIITHEMAHIKHLHSVDNLLLEIVSILLWFNPMVYLYNKSLKEVHEYLADEEVLMASENTIDEYETLINKQLLNNIGFQLSNNFNMSNLKTRIIMTTKPRSKKRATLKVLIVIPVMGLLMVSFSMKHHPLNEMSDARKAVINKEQGMYFRCTLNGEHYIAKSYSCAPNTSFSYSIKGSATDSTDLVFTLRAVAVSKKTGQMAGCELESAFYFINRKKYVLEPNKELMEMGRITAVKDTVTKTISGTFSFDLKEEKGSKVAVSNGEYRVGY